MDRAWLLSLDSCGLGVMVGKIIWFPYRDGSTGAGRLHIETLRRFQNLHKGEKSLQVQFCS